MGQPCRWGRGDARASGWPARQGQVTPLQKTVLQRPLDKSSWDVTSTSPSPSRPTSGSAPVDSIPHPWVPRSCVFWTLEGTREQYSAFWEADYLPVVQKVSFVKLGNSRGYLGGALEGPGPKHLSHSPSVAEGTQAGTVQCREHAKPSKGYTPFCSFRIGISGP